MKLSISLPAADVAVLDSFAQHSGLPSRSAAVQFAIRLLKHPDLEQDYAEAWDDWQIAGDGAAWEPTVADWMVDAAR